MVRGLFAALVLLAGSWQTLPAANIADVNVGYVRRAEHKLTLSFALRSPENDGVAGAKLAVDDNNTTGRFLNQRFSLEEAIIREGDDPVAAIRALADRQISLIIADLPADALLRAADSGRSRGLILFNIGAPDERLREEDCRPNVIHVAPSRSMLADGLAQYLVWKRWRAWLLVVGSHPEDRLFADAIRRAASRFGAKIVQERVFEDTGGARQTDSGIAQVQRQISAFTQGAPAHDVLMAADENEVFAGYLPYRTWEPKPVAGSAGLVPTTWDASHDQWGAAQLQNRFTRMFARRMTALDMQAWTAGRMIGESAARARSAEPKALIDFMTGPDFAVAAFKGQALTLRDWNRQLRQPILLADGRLVVSVSPQEGFLHQVSELDTLGSDRPESKCRMQ